MFQGSSKASDTTPSPSRISPSTLFVSEMTTTTTEILSPATGSPTQWFSIPYWRKRNLSQPPSMLHRSSENSPARLATSHSSRLLSLDKALPPTPPNEIQDSKDAGNPVLLQHRSPHLPIHQQESKTAEAQNVTRSTPSTPILSRGLSIALAAASSRVEMNMSAPVVPSTFLTPSSSSDASNSFPQIRRAKSAHRLRAPKDQLTSELFLERRRRGVSFGATNLFMNASDTASKGKGNELELSPNPSKTPPQPLSRRPSFWSRRKSSITPTIPSSPPPPLPLPPQNDNLMRVLPLPLVDVSPFAPEFTIEPFPLSKPNSKTTTPQRLQTDNLTTTPGSTTSSTTSLEVVDSPLPNQEALLPTRPARGHATPPLLHRLSFGVFSSDPSPIVRPIFPNQYHSQSAPALPLKSSAQIPKDGESPEGYVSRLKIHVGKTEVASVLASSSDIFYARALNAYLGRFQFSGIPLDVALRKLLMEVGLPRETQQIDRVMEAFAFRYRQCNPNLFTSEDHPYILAFSLIMLHTDAFNPSNKRKMTKADYIKNTKLPGIPTEILDCFFDNIVFAPFIFIEDPEDVENSSGLTIDLTGSVSTLTSTPTSAFRTTNKVDPYYLIMNDLLDPLRVDVNSYIPLENPFTYEGANGPWDEERLHNTFRKAHLIDVELPLAFRPVFNVPAVSPQGGHSNQETYRLSVIRTGVLNKKDDLAEGGKKALSRKWKTWAVVLCGSHLLFCRDPTWVSASLPSPEPSQQPGGTVNTRFRPDDIYSLKDGIAVYDRSYKKYNHAFRFVLPDGRQLLLQAANDEDLQQWISCINYASTFKSAGVGMHHADVSHQDIHPTDTAASRRPKPFAPSITLNNLMDSSGKAQNKLGPSPSKTLVNDLHVTQSSPGNGNADKLKPPFKTDLTISITPVDENLLPVLDDGCISRSPLISPPLMSNSSPRPQIILKKIRELDGKISALHLHLESDERRARNVAILTPFRKTTRSKLLAVMQNLAKPLLRKRLEMEKLKCYRTVLHNDLISDRIRTKRTTMRVATDPVRPRRPNTAPTSSPIYDTFAKISTPLSTPASQSTSTSASFHSAKESAFDWPSSPPYSPPAPDFQRPEASISSSGTVTVLEPEHEDTLIETPSSSQNDHQDRKTHPHLESSSENVSQGDDDDQAEDWNKTRVAQRVSLIQIPSDFALATRLKAVFDSNKDEG